MDTCTRLGVGPSFLNDRIQAPERPVHEDEGSNGGKLHRSTSTHEDFFLERASGGY